MTSASDTSTALWMREVSVPSLHEASVCVAAGVNWSVARGDFWVIAGPQRVGKTDFLLMAAGLSAPLRGEYQALAETMPVFDDTRLPERPRLGLLFEGGKLFQNLTVAENVALPLCYHGNMSLPEAWPQVERLLQWMELAAHKDALPMSLSHDLQARAGLARALGLRPDLLFLDNPLARLDARGEAWWRNLLGDLNRGVEWTGGQPVTLVATSELLRPWRGCARQFAWLDPSGFRVIGDESALAQFEVNPPG